jgi:4-hydroxybenzoate polyprenyltransferase
MNTTTRVPSRPTLGGLLRGAHLGPALAVTAGTVAMSARAGRSAPGLLAVAAAILCGQLSVGWCNDWVDAGRDLAAGRSDKPVVRGRATVWQLRTAALSALVLAGPLSLLSGARAGAAHLVAALAAWLYDVRLKDTVLSWAPYVVAFGSLPAFVTLGLPGAPAPPLWALAAGALVGFGAHLLNTVPDLADDAATGVRGLPHRLGAGPATSLGALALGAAAAVVVLAPPGSPSPGLVAGLAGVAIVDAGALVTTRAGRREVSWPLTIATASGTVGLLLLQGGALA